MQAFQKGTIKIFSDYIIKGQPALLLNINMQLVVNNFVMLAISRGESISLPPYPRLNENSPLEFSISTILHEFDLKQSFY